MSKAATRLHLTGGILFLLDGVAHTIGQFAPDPSPFARNVEQTMRGWIVPGTRRAA